MRFKCLLLISAVVLLPVVSWTDTYTAASVSLADVTDAYNAASDGDIVAIPAGSAIWSSWLLIRKAITLRGAGSGATVITANASNTELIALVPGSNKAQRVTGIGFVGGTYQVQIAGSRNNSYVLDRVRIDHCSFTNGNSVIYTSGWIEGLIDNNYFLNCNRGIMISGDGNYAWTREIKAGTAHALFIEDNTFKETNAGGGA